jgi:hypothetical protein
VSGEGFALFGAAAMASEGWEVEKSHAFGYAKDGEIIYVP